MVQKFKVADAVITVVLLLIAATSLLPLLHVIAMSFSEKSAAMAGRVTVLPIDFTVAPYTFLLQEQRFWTAFGVSVRRVLLGGGIQLVLTLLMAYALSKETSEFRTRNVYMWFIVFTMLFNGGLIPWYMVIREAGLLDSIWALVLPSAVPVFNIIILMNFFRGLPKEIKEAAVMDGCGPWRTLLTMFIPLSLPAIATVTLFSVVNHWNAFFDGMVLMISNSNIPLQTYIQQLVVRPADLSMLQPDDMAALSERTFNAAKIVVTMVPVLLIYPFLQKYFVKGIVLGSVKE